MTGKIVIKRILSSVFSFSGIHLLAERISFSNKSAILMYHRILPSAGNQPYFIQPGMFVSTAAFERQIVFLKDRFEIVFLEDLVEKAMKGERIGGLCAITFDDGWRDNFTDAFPILNKYRVPATIFLATGFIGTDNTFWSEELCYYLDRTRLDTASFSSAPQSYIRYSKEISRYRQCIQETFLDRSIEIMKGYSPCCRDEILRYLRSMHKTDVIPRQMLSWDEAREMFSSGRVRFGAHTVNHEILDHIPLDKARDEISRSRAEIENRHGVTIRTFAYPNGNYNGSIRKILEENGFNAAVTTKKGFFDAHTNHMEIPRIAIHEDVSSTIPMFRSKILFSQF